MIDDLLTFLWTDCRDLFSRSATVDDIDLLEVAKKSERTISLYVFQKGCAAPICQIKAVRKAEDEAMIRQEFKLLQEVRGRLAGTDIRDSVPQVFTLTEINKSSALVMSVVPRQ